MNTLENLRAVRELLSDESRWTKKLYATDERGKAVDEKSREACSWCLVGAVVKVTSTEAEVDQILTSLYRLVGNIASFNDNASHAQLLAKLDEVIDGYPY